MVSKLKKKRLASRLLQNDVAKILNVKSSHISKMERGLVPVKQLEWWLFALIYQCKRHELTDRPMVFAVKNEAVRDWFEERRVEKTLSFINWSRDSGVVLEVILEFFSGRTYPEKGDLRKLLVALFPDILK